MRVGITGAAGYIGKSLCTSLADKHDIISITKDDFDLTNVEATAAYFSDKYFDVIIHTAIDGGSRLVTDTSSVLDNNLQMYYNLLSNSNRFNRFISIGSGAEIYHSHTPYGLSKHVIRQSMSGKNQFYNIRVFAVFDENELDTRFIKANIKRYIDKNDIIIHQNRHMDFFFMQDFVQVMNYYITANDPPKEFDCTYKESPSLYSIATFINTLSDHNVYIVIEDEEMASEYVGTYTPSELTYIGLERGIELVYEKLTCSK